MVNAVLSARVHCTAGPVVQGIGGTRAAMKKLLFIIPPYFNADDYLNKSRAAVLPSFTIPYGILSMESYLSAHCRATIDLQLLDLNITLQRLVEKRFEGDYSAIFAAEIETRLREFRPKFAGISALFNS